MSQRPALTLAVILVSLFVLFLALSYGLLRIIDQRHRVGDGRGPHVGVVAITGEIQDLSHEVDELWSFIHDDSIAAIVVRVDSPGGAVGASQEMFHAILNGRDKKKIVTSMGNLAASGGFYLAVAGNKVFANDGTITGSIGVISQFFGVQKLAERALIDPVTVKSNEYKDSGSPFRAFTDQDRAYFQELTDEIHSQFVADVAKARGLPLEEVKKRADGKVFSGRQALSYGLVDQIGGLHDAAMAALKLAGRDLAPGDTGPVLVYPEEPGAFLQGWIDQLGSSIAGNIKRSFRGFSDWSQLVRLP